MYTFVYNSALPCVCACVCVCVCVCLCVCACSNITLPTPGDCVDFAPVRTALTQPGGGGEEGAWSHLLTVAKRGWGGG